MTAATAITAHEQGFDAARAGLPLDANPYADDRANWWADGWHKGVAQ